MSIIAEDNDQVHFSVGISYGSKEKKEPVIWKRDKADVNICEQWNEFLKLTFFQVDAHAVNSPVGFAGNDIPAFASEIKEKNITQGKTGPGYQTEEERV